MGKQTETTTYRHLNDVAIICKRCQNNIGRIVRRYQTENKMMVKQYENNDQSF